MSVTKKIEFFFREKRSEEVKRNSVSDEFRGASVDIFDTDKRELLVSCLWRLDLSCNSVAGLQRVLLDLILGHIDVVRGVEIVVV